MILMLVLLTAVVANAASAGDTTVYGKLHMSINSINDSENSALGLSSNTSRFGVKGTSEMNDTFTLIWQFEQALNLAQKGSETLANRNSFLGLKGTWGTALWGIHDTPYKTLGRKGTFFYDSIGDNRQVMMHVDDRNDDYLMYTTPDFDGFGVQVGYEFDQNAAGSDNAATSFAGMATYAKDAIFVGVAYEALSKGMFSAMDDPDVNSETRMRFAGKYTAEKFAIAVSYQMLTDYMGVTDRKSTTLGGEILFNATPEVDVKAGYYIVDSDTEEIAGADWGASLMTIGVDYNFTKAVQLYLQYAGVANKDNGQRGMGDYNGFGAPTDVAAMGETVSGFSFGSVVKF
jgi:predicted porin